MKKLLLASALLLTPFAHSAYVPDSLDEEFCKHWWGTKDEQILASLAKIYLAHKANDLDKADFYMDVLEMIIHDEPFPD